MPLDNSLVNLLGDGVIVTLDPSFYIVESNINGLNTKDSLKESLANEDEDRLVAFLTRLLKSGKSGIIQFRLRLQNSEKAWMQFFWERIEQEGDFYLVGMGHPTQSLDDERIRLIGSDAAYNEAEELAQMGSWWVNPADSSNRWSLGNYKLWGLDPLEPPPSLKWIFSKMHPDDAPNVLNAMKEVEKGNPSGPVRFRMRLNDQHEYRHFLSRIKPWYVHDELVEVKGINLEITDLIRYQESLERQNKVLAERNELLSKYLFINSHEVRGSLSNILSIIELVNNADTDTDEVIRLLNLASKKLDKTLNKINEILSGTDN